MRICPKCLSTYGNELNFCQACGTMMNTLTEGPLPASGHPTEDERPATTPPSIEVASVDEDTSLPETDELNRTVVPTLPIGQCPKCGSTKLVIGARIRDRDNGSNKDLEVFVDTEPGALIFKNRMYAKLLADICGECGHAELKAENPGSLYRHYLLSKR